MLDQQFQLSPIAKRFSHKAIRIPITPKTLLYNFYAIHYVSILLCQVIPLARLLLLLYAKKSKFIFFVINRGSRGTTLFSPGVFIHVKTHNYLKG